jgi:hypothetical protein
VVRVRVTGTVDSSVARQFGIEVSRRRENAVCSGDSKIPTTSDVLQDVLQRGLARVQGQKP